MEIFPAVDLRNGNVVRLFQGDYSKMTVYSDDPLSAANGFINDGAQNLHVVDLDGAKDGTLANYGTIARLAAIDGLFVEVGGGIRDISRVEKYLSCGAGRVIIGTQAVRNYGFVKEAAKLFPGKIAVGVDAKDGKVAIDGWKTVTDIDSIEFCKKLFADGVENVIYTDISKDGGLSGTNLDVYYELQKINGLKITASGGITFEKEISALKAAGIYAAILGKAIYDGKLSLKNAIRIAKE